VEVILLWGVNLLWGRKLALGEVNENKNA